MSIFKKTNLILILSVSLFLLQITTAFDLQINSGYFDNTNILTGNRGEITFDDSNNDGYGVFFIGSGQDSNTTLKINDSMTIHCAKQLNGYYAILYTNFLMLGIDSNTVNHTNTQRLTDNIQFITGGLFYECSGAVAGLTIKKQNGVYGYIERRYGSGDEVNIHKIRAGLTGSNGNYMWAETSPFELVYSTSTGYTAKTLSGKFYSSLVGFGNTVPREIGDIWVSNGNVKYETGVYVINYDTFKNPGMQISIITSIPGISTYVDISGHVENETGNTGTINSRIFSGVIPSGSIPAGNVFTGAFGYYGYKEITFTGNYRLLSGTITLNIGTDRSRSINYRVEGGEPCLSGWDNDYFITPDFWQLNRRKGGPTDSQIKCAIFGYEDLKYNENNGAGYKTAYTTGRESYDRNTCANITVVRTGNLPQNLSQNTIYVLDSTGINLSTLNIPKCTAIISKANYRLNTVTIQPEILYGKDTTLNGSLVLNGDNIVLDNLSINTTNSGISINNQKNVTLNVVKVYNASIGVYLYSSSKILLNNIQVFNNNIGIESSSSNNIAIDNTQSYRNNIGIKINNTSNSILYNNAIYQNNTGLNITNSSNNIFTNLELIDNNGNHHIYMNGGNYNTGTYINLWGSNYASIDNNTKIEGFNKITNSSTTYNKKITYTCKGGTNITCLYNNSSQYYCTGAISANYENSKKDFSASGYYLDGIPRELSISGENTAIFNTYLISGSQNEETEQTRIPLNFNGPINLWRNVDAYEFSGNGINGSLTPNVGGYDVMINYSGLVFSGSGKEIVKPFILSGTTTNIQQLGGMLCEHDGGYSGYTQPIIINTNIINSTTTTPIFSYGNGNGLDERGKVCSYANCITNPKLAGEGYDYLNPWTRIPSGKTGPVNIGAYSYGIGLNRQQDVLLPGGAMGGKIKNTGYYGGYFIGSNVPAKRIEWSSIEVLSKIHYRIGGRSNLYNSFFNIISLTERNFPIQPIRTITGFNVGPWGEANRIRQQYYGTATNNIYGITGGSYSDLYLTPGDTNHYPIVLQVYQKGDTYFATHRWMTRLARENIQFEAEPTIRCIAPDQDTIQMTGQRLTHENEGIIFRYRDAPLIGANITGAKSNSFSNNNISDFTISNETGKVSRTLSIPCSSGNICNSTISLNGQYISDILNFKSSNRGKTYIRDMKGPDIQITATGAVECRDTTLRIKLKDECIGASGFMISGWINTGWIELETSTGWNLNWYDIIIDSGNVGRTGITETGAVLHKTGVLTAIDKYNNISTGLLDVKIIDQAVTIATGYSITSALDILNGRWITGHDENIYLDVIETFGVNEGDCGTGDLYITGFKCFLSNSNNARTLGNEIYILTGIISGDLQHLTIKPSTQRDHYGYYSGVICTINIKDNENNSKTGYMKFNINTVHKPLFDQDPIIVSGTKYIEYLSGDSVYRDNSDSENINITGQNQNSKYSSGDIIYIQLYPSNEFANKYYVSCTGFYTGTDNSYWTPVPSNNIIQFTGIENCATSGQIILNVSTWNGEDDYQTNTAQFTTGQTDFVFFDNTSPNTSDSDDSENKNNKIIITSGQNINKDVRVKDEHSVDSRENISGYTSGTFILNTGILRLYLSGNDDTLSSNITAKIINSTTTVTTKNRKVNISGVIIKDTNYDIIEDQICLNIETGLLRDFSINRAMPLDLCTKYRYTSRNPIYISGSKWGRTGIPENDISILRVKIDSGVLQTGLSFQLLTAKPITLDDIECTGFVSNFGQFYCTEISNSGVISATQKVCIKWKENGDKPECEDRERNGYNPTLKIESGFTIGNYHRMATFSRLNTIKYEIYSGVENSGYYNTHTGEREFFGKVSIRNDNNKFNDEFVRVSLYENKTPFKAGSQGIESFSYKSIGNALNEYSGDNGFFFYISRPQRINTGNIHSGVVGDISYEINFNTGVADEFYHITGEAVINGYKETLGIKRPTYNYANPKGYLFNFPDYSAYDEN